jgi:hypothetical protein
MAENRVLAFCRDCRERPGRRNGNRSRPLGRGRPQANSTRSESARQSVAPNQATVSYIARQLFSGEVQIGRLCGDLRHRFRVPLVSAGVFVSGLEFCGPVSASKDSVPGGQGSSTDPALVAREPDLGAVARQKIAATARLGEPSRSNCLTSVPDCE